MPALSGAAPGRGAPARRAEVLLRDQPDDEGRTRRCSSRPRRRTSGWNRLRAGGRALDAQVLVRDVDQDVAVVEHDDQRGAANVSTIARTSNQSSRRRTGARVLLGAGRLRARWDEGLRPAGRSRLGDGGGWERQDGVISKRRHEGGRSGGRRNRLGEHGPPGGGSGGEGDRPHATSAAGGARRQFATKLVQFATRARGYRAPAQGLGSSTVIVATAGLDASVASAAAAAPC